MKKPNKSQTVSYTLEAGMAKKNQSLRETTEPQISAAQHLKIKEKLFLLHEQLLRKLAQ